MRALVCKPPQISADSGYKKVFLAGSIDMGKADDWQSKIIEAVKEFPLQIFNPRRDDWDSNWEQDITNPDFKEQVMWELDNLENSDMIVMVLTKGSIAPISLMEFGLFARSKKLFVFCPDGFWRKGNVDIVCEKYNIPQVVNFEELITLIKYA